MKDMNQTPADATNETHDEDIDLVRAIRIQLANQSRKNPELLGKFSVQNLNRRSFLKLTGITGGSLLLASILPANPGSAEELGSLVGSVELNAFIKVSSDGRIVIYSSNPEMGQGIKTALPMVIAEEMGAKWEDVEVLQSEVDESRFGRHGAGGSTTIPRTFDQMRTMGASAREMFIGAASIAMELPREELHAQDSTISHLFSSRSLSFGDLAALAVKQAVPDPDSLVFKDKADYTIIGTSVTGVDNLDIVTGLALFGIDVRVPEMLYGAYQKCPAFGGLALSANLDEIKKMSGIKDAFIVEGNGNVRELSSGVAIVGTSTWAVFNAKRKLKVKWDESGASKDSWTEMVRSANQIKDKQGEDLITDNGDVDKAFLNPDNKTISAFYQYPFVSHLCLEPMNCSANYQAGKNGKQHTLELWIPTQAPTRAYPIAKSMFGLEQGQVKIHQMRLGGSFGRRVYSEYICEVIEMSRHVGAPVKLTWTREDDLQHDFYRVGGFQAVKGSVNRKGEVVAFDDHFIGMTYKGGGRISGSGFRATEFPMLNLKHTRASKTMFDIETPCGPWRAPGANTTAFVIQSFIHELAHEAGRDHLDVLLEIMGKPRWFEQGNIRSLNTGRAADVIKLAAAESNWGRKMPRGYGLGLAFHFSHAAHVAEVAEVSVDRNKKLTVHNVTVAVDVGPIINMSGATSQVEGAVIDGFSTMMGQKITMENGRIEQSNLHDYQVLRIPDAPKVDIHFIQSDYSPTGLGEPALPPLAPAVANAIFAATGHRVRTMPLTDEGFSV
ncbi:MAG TPA: xanthine dehydrogenase family protein molybdopterin-binding subunit [Gammaproteobacteria bacterium]|nr:xanthine dehydrogenase family protein molybdopterin-binding subunit [Gammaproteobacteria bacterium]HIL96720.1 xanthine dehydrogenase family protein molybdopterin-binding subunit [Pseudomonadales bacterium]